MLFGQALPDLCRHCQASWAPTATGPCGVLGLQPGLGLQGVGMLASLPRYTQVVIAELS